MNRARERWLRERTKGVGGSDAPCVLGLNKWKSSVELWGEKTGLVTPPSLDDNDAVTAGHLFEAPVARWYASKTGRALKNPGRYRSRWSESVPFMFATVDRYVFSRERGEEGGVLEVKTTDARNADAWAERVPPMVYAQVQHNIAVCGAKWGSVAVLIGGNSLRWADVERDEPFIAELIEAERAFWACVSEQRPPAIDGSEAATRALSLLYPKDDGTSVVLVPAFAVLDEERERLKAQSKECDERVREIDNTIKSALRDALVGRIEGTDVSYRWQTIERKAYAVEAATVRQLRRVVA